MTQVLTDTDPEPDDAGEPPARSHLARNTALVVGAVLVLFIAVLATRKPPEDAVTQLVGRRVPALSGPTLDGGRFDIDTQLARPELGVPGKWVLVNFLASWCVGCIEEHPDLVRFAKAHRDDVQIVGVAYNDDAEKLREFFRLRGGDWPVIMAERNTPAYDFGVTGVPESFLVRPDGMVVAWAQGVTYDWLEAQLDAGAAAGAPR
jgi:cytochrome c biogenesis protein CcmG/thiol:disulfide interchange protein DsbE